MAHPLSLFTITYQPHAPSSSSSQADYLFGLPSLSPRPRNNLGRKNVGKPDTNWTTMTSLPRNDVASTKNTSSKTGSEKSTKLNLEEPSTSHPTKQRKASKASKWKPLDLSSIDSGARSSSRPAACGGAASSKAASSHQPPTVTTTSKQHQTSTNTAVEERRRLATDEIEFVRTDDTGKQFSSKVLSHTSAEKTFTKFDRSKNHQTASVKSSSSGGRIPFQYMSASQLHPYSSTYQHQVSERHKGDSFYDILDQIAHPYHTPQGFGNQFVHVNLPQSSPFESYHSRDSTLVTKTIESHCPQDLEDDASSVVSESESVKAKTRAIMEKLSGNRNLSQSHWKENDAFDSLDWDPDLPSAASPDHSPEPVAIKPQALAYTTVGSLINPNAVPQFSAPNRIQREGANRRPLMALLQNQPIEALFPSRGPPPPLNMSNSMQYAQQLGKSPSRYTSTSSSAAGPSSRVTQPAVLPTALKNLDLTDQEKEILLQQFETRYPQIQGGNARPKATNTSFTVKEALEEDAHRRTNSTRSFQGLEKMQTLQRLAKFANPMQELAQSRLSEFSVAKSATDNVKPTNESGYVSYEEFLRRGAPPKADTRAEYHGSFDAGFQFPAGQFPTGSQQQSTNTHTNPLYGAYGLYGSGTRSSAPSRPPGYPQPLTAGPPGNRQAAYNTTQSARVPPVARPLQQQASAQLQATTTSSSINEYSPWHPPGHPGLNNRYSSTRIVDTMAMEDLVKYYPNGFPLDMTGEWNPMSDDNRKAMGVPPMTAEEKSNAAIKHLDDVLYQGQRRYATMNAVAYLQELKAHEEARDRNPLGPIAAPTKITEPIIPKKLTIEEMNNMSLGEATKPILTAAFGTYLAYHQNGPGSFSAMSKFSKPDDKYIDSSEKGNKSLYGEDWGAPPESNIW